MRGVDGLGSNFAVFLRGEVEKREGKKGIAVEQSKHDQFISTQSRGYHENEIIKQKRIAGVEFDLLLGAAAAREMRYGGRVLPVSSELKVFAAESLERTFSLWFNCNYHRCFLSFERNIKPTKP